MSGGPSRRKRPEKPKKEPSKERKRHDTERFFSLALVDEDLQLFGPRAENALSIINDPIYTGGNDLGRPVTKADIIISPISQKPYEGNMYLRFYNLSVDARQGGPILENIQTALSPQTNIVNSPHNWYPLIPVERTENIVLGGEGDVSRTVHALGIKIRGANHIVRVTNKTYNNIPLVCVRLYDPTAGGLVDMLATFAFSQSDPRVEDEGVSFGRRRSKVKNTLKQVNNDIKYLLKC
jgi:hypothetical protein